MPSSRTALLGHAGHCLLATLGDLLGRQVFLVRGDRPLMPEWVLDAAEAIAPEHVFYRHRHRRAGIDGFLHGGVDVLRVDKEARADSSELLRRLGRRLRKRIGEHDQRVPDLDLGVGDFAVRAEHPAALLRAEGSLVELDRFRRVRDGEVRRDGAVTLWNRLYGHDPPSVGSDKTILFAERRRFSGHSSGHAPAKRATPAGIPTPLKALADGPPQAIQAPGRSTPRGAAVRGCYFVKRTFAKWYVRSSSATMSWRQVPAHERSVCHRYVYRPSD